MNQHFRPYLILLFTFLIFSAHRLVSQNNDPIRLKANNYYNEKQYHQAIELFKELNHPSEHDLLIWGKALMKINEHEQALQILEKTFNFQNPPKEAYFFIGLNRCHLDTSDNYPTAKPFFEQYIKLAQPDTAGQLNYLRQAYHYLSSYHVYKTNDYDSSIYYANKVLNISQNNTTYQITAFSTLVLAYFKKKNYELADNYCRNLLLFDSSKVKKDICKEIHSYRRGNSINYWQERINTKESFREIKKAIEEEYNLSTTKDSIPENLIDMLKLWNSSFCFANPDEPWQSTDIISKPRLPERRILFILKNQNHAFLVYKHGGVGTCNQYIWVRLSGNHITDFWAATTLENIDTKEKLREFIHCNPPHPQYLNYL